MTLYVLGSVILKLGDYLVVRKELAPYRHLPVL